MEDHTRHLKAALRINALAERVAKAKAQIKPDAPDPNAQPDPNAPPPGHTRVRKPADPPHPMVALRDPNDWSALGRKASCK